jgi:hypothetical protein
MYTILYYNILISTPFPEFIIYDSGEATPCFVTLMEFCFPQHPLVDIELIASRSLTTMESEISEPEGRL